jgi:hypothetical protein
MIHGIKDVLNQAGVAGWLPDCFLSFEPIDK